MARDDPDLVSAQDMLWMTGYYEYFKEGNKGTKTWGEDS